VSLPVAKRSMTRLQGETKRR